LHADLPTFAGGEYRVVLQFSQESIRQYMGEGWRVEPNNLSWTVGNRAELRLPLPEFAGDWTFQATLKPFLAAGKLDRQRLALSVGEDTLAEWKLDQEDFVTIEWSLPGKLAGTGSPLELVFSLPDASSPHELGAGTDQRKLGVAVLSLVISNHAGGDRE
jgi:hypothetical protein